MDPTFLAENYGNQVTEHGQLCIVPWKYNGQSYEGCANPNNKPRVWCPTKLNDDGQFESGSVHWGYCSVMSRIRECLKENGISYYHIHLLKLNLNFRFCYHKKKISDPDCFCSILPYSMTSGGQSGCRGAIWGSGDPAEKYCKNDDRFPWWQNCCTWKWGSYWNPITFIEQEGYNCLPKSGG